MGSYLESDYQSDRYDVVWCLGVFQQRPEQFLESRLFHQELFDPSPQVQIIGSPTTRPGEGALESAQLRVSCHQESKLKIEPFGHVY